MAGDELVEPFGAALAPLDIEPQRLAVSFHDAVRQKAVEAFGHKSEFDSLELETKLWDLVTRLSSATPETSRASLVVGWIQSNLRQPPEPAGLQSIKWMYTHSQAGKRGGHGAVVSELDLDAPLRQARPIAEEDRVRDDTLYKYVFDLLLAGQNQLALDACADTNNWLLRAALNVMVDVKNDDGVAIGAPTKDGVPKSADSLVLDACRTLSSAPSSQISTFEAAVYGLLCGNLAAVKPLCDSWETLLVAHLLAGASLESFERSVAQDHKIALQDSDWRRKIALALIQDRFEELVAQLVVEVRDPNTTASSAIVQNPWLTRVLLHIELALGHKVDPTLTQVYIEYLCQDPAMLASRLDLIPKYVRLLDSSNTQAKIYGHVLAQIADPEIQTRQAELASAQNLAIGPAIEVALQLNFELYESTLSDSATEQNESNERLVGVLHWPVAAELWSIAARAITDAYTLLLLRNQRSGIILLTTQISTEYVRERAMDSIRARLHENPDVVAHLSQLRQYALLGNAIAALHAWTSSDRDIQGWRTLAPKLVGNVIDSVNASLQFAPPSSSSSSSSLSLAESALDDMNRIRSQYIPLIVYDFLNILQEAQSVSPGYAKVALEFAVKIADDDLKLYELFDAKLLQRLAEPALVASR